MQSKISLALGTDRIHDSRTNDYTINTLFTINIHGRPNWRHVDLFHILLVPTHTNTSKVDEKAKSKKCWQGTATRVIPTRAKKGTNVDAEIGERVILWGRKPDKKDGWLSKGDFK